MIGETQEIHCRQAEKETHGAVKRVTLTRMICHRAAECRRRGICVFSELAQSASEDPNGAEFGMDVGGRNLYTLHYRNASGYYWLKVNSKEEALAVYADANRTFDGPHILRCITFEKL